MDDPPFPLAPPRTLLDDVAAARADVAAGRVRQIDLDALCRDIEAEADEIEAEQARQAAPSRA
jgi:hypothetical protein